MTEKGYKANNRMDCKNFGFALNVNITIIIQIIAQNLKYGVIE